MSLGHCRLNSEALYSPTGRPSISPEKLLRALLLKAFHSIRSERQLMEPLDVNLRFRWFVGIDDPVWDTSSVCHSRDRFLEAEVSARLLSGVAEHKLVRRLLSRDYFSVDGTLIEAWASMKSFRRKDGADDDTGPGRNGERDLRGASFTSPRQVREALGRFIEAYNVEATPFEWRKTKVHLVSLKKTYADLRN